MILPIIIAGFGLYAVVKQRMAVPAVTQTDGTAQPVATNPNGGVSISIPSNALALRPDIIETPMPRMAPTDDIVNIQTGDPNVTPPVLGNHGAEADYAAMAFMSVQGVPLATPTYNGMGDQQSSVGGAATTPSTAGTWS